VVGFLIPPSETAAPVVASNSKEEENKVEGNKVLDPKTSSGNTADVKKAEDQNGKAEKPVEIKQPTQAIITTPAKVETAKTDSAPAIQETKNTPSTQGYFKTSFDQQVKKFPVSKNETVTAGIFRTNNGIQDAKYYLLIDAISPGTIVRVINPENNKAIYAKVLGQMDGIRQNVGLNIRISNIAANTLGISDTEKFIVKINY
jgi:hypothetical protein